MKATISCKIGDQAVMTQVVGGATDVWQVDKAEKIEVELPQGHKLVIEELDTDVLIIMHYCPDGPVVLESVMKETS